MQQDISESLKALCDQLGVPYEHVQRMEITPEYAVVYCLMNEENTAIEIKEHTYKIRVKTK